MFLFQISRNEDVMVWSAVSWLSRCHLQQRVKRKKWQMCSCDPRLPRVVTWHLPWHDMTWHKDMTWHDTGAMLPLVSVVSLLSVSQLVMETSASLVAGINTPHYCDKIAEILYWQYKFVFLLFYSNVQIVQHLWNDSKIFNHPRVCMFWMFWSFAHVSFPEGRH